MSIKLFVEGGGDSRLLHSACREGFTNFLKNAGLAGQMPRVFACGSRQNAYRDFCIALTHGETAMLLVDSETAVDSKHQEPGAFDPWEHLRQRKADQWEKPAQARSQDCHLMVQCMEHWLLADRETLQRFFGRGFNAAALPTMENHLETLNTQQVLDALAKASKDCRTQSPYGKGEHSFKLLALINPAKVSAASPWAKRFLETLRESKP